jgi:hypothetical protein
MASLKDIQTELRRASLENLQKNAGGEPLAPDRVEALLQQGKSIYGSDSRVEAAGDADVPAQVIRAVCVLVETTRLQPAPGGHVLQTEPFGAKYNLCPGQRFRDQPLLGYGTGFLVAPDVIATAGHCVAGYDVSQICALFDFELRNNQVDITRPADKVYYATEVLTYRVESDGADYALVRLDRAVRGAKPLSLREQDAVLGEPVYVVGHPVGLPKKVAQGAKVLDTKSSTCFLANLDTFGGNSGSPVLTADNKVCGILVRGAKDFVQKGNCIVAATFPLNKAGESVCRVSVWGGLIPADKLSRLSDVASPGPQPGKRVADKGACRRKIESFLSTAFTTEELRRLVRYNLILDPLIKAVNWNGALADVATQMVESLERENLLGGDFFGILKAERPRRLAEIEEIERDCAGRKQARAKSVARAAPAKKKAAKPAISRRTVYQALLNLSPEEFNVLLDVELDQQARLAVSRQAGQSEMARDLITHFDVSHRGLKELAKAIRGVAPKIV